MNDRTREVKLSDIFDFEELYEKYPYLEDTFLKIVEGTGGYYDGENNTIGLGLRSFLGRDANVNPEAVKEIIVHELQHGIQSRNPNFPGGSSVEYIQDQPFFKDILKDIGERERRGEITEDQFRDEVENASRVAFSIYQANSGEIQARAAELRRHLSSEERRETPPSVTYRMALQETLDKYRDQVVMPTYRRSDRPYSMYQNDPDYRPYRPEPVDVTPEEDTITFPEGFAEGGLVTNNALSDYFKASSGVMTEMEFVGKHKMSTAEFERKFEEQNNVDISGTEKLTEIKGMNKPKGYAEGGTVGVDPVSGNRIPIGSSAKEVRDDVPAMLSEGEYVVPADVVQYFGVAFFENLRNKAKGNLQELAQNGRTGGQGVTMEEVEEALHMAEGGVVDTQSIGSLIDRVAQTVKSSPEMQQMFASKGISMAEGGLVPSFNPQDWSTVGASTLRAPTAPQAPQQAVEYRQYVDAAGNIMMLMFINGQPVQGIPEGYYPVGEVPEQTQTKSKSTRREEPRETREVRGPLDELDFGNPESITQWASDRLAGNRLPIPGLAGSAVNYGMEARRIAEVRAAALAAENSGNQDLANSLRSSADEAESQYGLMGLIPDEWMDGDRIYESYADRMSRETGTVPFVPTTQTAPTQSTSTKAPVQSAKTIDESRSLQQATAVAKDTEGKELISSKETTKNPPSYDYDKAVPMNRGGLVTRPKK